MELDDPNDHKPPETQPGSRSSLAPHLTGVLVSKSPIGQASPPASLNAYVQAGGVTSPRSPRIRYARWVMEASGDLVGAVLGSYRIEHMLGRGGMGAVYEATHTLLETKVAIKVLAPQHAADERFRRRFLREARIVARIGHESIVQISDLAEQPLMFFVMERLVGQDLAAMLAAHGRLPWARAKPLIVQVGSALQAAHDAGVVHRDVKPSNIFVQVKDDGREFAKVLDFGIAKIAGPEVDKFTATNEIVGTSAYIAPEQALGNPVDGRTDVYALGVVLFELLTGTTPFSGPAMVLLAKHLQEAPPALPWAELGLPSELDAIIRKALSKKQQDRFQSMRELCGALKGIPVDGAEPEAVWTMPHPIAPLGASWAPGAQERILVEGTARLAPTPRTPLPSASPDLSSEPRAPLEDPPAGGTALSQPSFDRSKDETPIPPSSNVYALSTSPDGHSTMRPAPRRSVVFGAALVVVLGTAALTIYLRNLSGEPSTPVEQVAVAASLPAEVVAPRRPDSAAAQRHEHSIADAEPSGEVEAPLSDERSPPSDDSQVADPQPKSAVDKAHPSSSAAAAKPIDKSIKAEPKKQKGESSDDKVLHAFLRKASRLCKPEDPISVKLSVLPTGGVSLVTTDPRNRCIEAEGKKVTFAKRDKGEVKNEIVRPSTSGS